MQMIVITLRGVLQHEWGAAGGLHGVGIPWGWSGKLGKALGLGMPLVPPPHGMMLMQLVLYGSCQLNTFLPACDSAL